MRSNWLHALKTTVKLSVVCANFVRFSHFKCDKFTTAASILEINQRTGNTMTGPYCALLSYVSRVLLTTLLQIPIMYLIRSGILAEWKGLEMGLIFSRP